MKNSERINHDKIYERLVIDYFINYRGITDKPSYAQNSGDFDFPDCIVPAAKLCIEETSVHSYANDKVETLHKSADQKTLLLQFHEDPSGYMMIDKIKNAVKTKDNHGPYAELPKTYDERILLVRIDGYGFDWKKKLAIVSDKSNYSELLLNIFTSVYLVVYPIVPTKYDIDNQVVHPQRSDFVQII